MTILEKYIEELAQEVKLDAFTVHDVQLKLPAIKHKWVGRQMRHKSTLLNLKQAKKAERARLVKLVREEAHVKVSQAAVGVLVDEHDAMILIDKAIEEQKIAIEFLEKMERVLNSMTFDIKNITEIMKLETQ
jgi:hypothetical protein